MAILLFLVLFCSPLTLSAFGIDDLNFLLRERQDLVGTKAHEYYKTLSSRSYHNANNHYRMKEAYQVRVRQSWRIIEDNLGNTQSKYMLAAATAAGGLHAGSNYIVTTPQGQHTWTKVGLFGGLAGGVASNKYLSQKSKTLTAQIKAVNRLLQLDDAHLVTYANNLQMKVRLDVIGIPQPFGNGDDRLVIPKSVLTTLAAYQKKSFDSPTEAAEWLKAAFRTFIDQQKTRLEKVYLYLATLTAFMYSTAALNAFGYTGTHRRLVEAQTRGS